MIQKSSGPVEVGGMENCNLHLTSGTTKLASIDQSANLPTRISLPYHPTSHKRLQDLNMLFQRQLPTKSFHVPSHNILGLLLGHGRSCDDCWEVLEVEDLWKDHVPVGYEKRYQGAPIRFQSFSWRGGEIVDTSSAIVVDPLFPDNGGVAGI